MTDRDEIADLLNDHEGIVALKAGVPHPAVVHASFDTLKMLRETFCVAQTWIGQAPTGGRNLEHIERLQRLIDDVDRQRPLGPNGKHGDRHTATCGCEDR